VRTYPLLRGVAIATLATYAILRNSSEPQWFFDVLLFNAVALFAVIPILSSPIPDDYLGRAGVSLAIALWTIGSIASSLSSFFTLTSQVDLDLVADISYSLFYPLILFGVTRSLIHRMISRSLELLDTVIVTLGITTIIAAFLFVQPWIASQVQPLKFS
jgi:hypothetical protein